MSASAGARNRKQVFPQNDYSDDDDFLDDSYSPEPQKRKSSKLSAHQNHNVQIQHQSGGSGPGRGQAIANPVTIGWLVQNYETGEGFSIPRNAVYSHYQMHCQEEQFEVLNAASFGKMIRSVFLGLRTRRLGTRGNSQYHYNGIRIKADSKLNRVGAVQYRDGHRGPVKPSDNHRPTRQTPYSRTKSYMQASPSSSECDLEEAHPNPSDEPNPHNANTNPVTQSMASVATPYAMYLGVGQVPNVTLQYDCMQNALATLGLSVMHADMFQHKYRQHCQDILSLVLNLQMAEVEECWRVFWQPKQNYEQSFTNQSACSGLSDTQLFSLCTVPEIQEFVRHMDCQFYDVLLEVLMPNLLMTVPSELLRMIRNFAKGLHRQLSYAMYGVPDIMQNIKLSVVTGLSQTLVRYTTLCHVAQSARQLFQNAPLIAQMIKDLDHVDFDNVLQQAVWVCGCDRHLVTNLQRDFKDNLHKQQPLESWAVWLEAVVDQMLAQYHDRPLPALAHAAKQFLLKWSFLSSIIFRDLEVEMDVTTSRSFHLMKLFLDDYLGYLVHLRMARFTNVTVIQVNCVNDKPQLADIMMEAGIKCEDVPSVMSPDPVNLPMGHPSGPSTQSISYFPSIALVAGSGSFDTPPANETPSYTQLISSGHQSDYQHENKTLVHHQL